MTAAGPTVQANSYLTLHYRLSLSDSGDDVVSTFGGHPATFQLGAGQMAEPLERCMLGLTEGARTGFDLDAGAAFGLRSPELVQKISRATLDARGGPDETFGPGDLLEFPVPGGGRFAGVLKEINDEWALFDFNHPLAGQKVRFEVEILGIL